jgi:SagB-type dehydrogenase family enzyme
MFGFFLGLVIIGGMGVVDSAIKLPAPDTVGNVTLEKTLLHRRSVRSYADRALTLRDVGQLLWAAQGKTGKSYGRTAPSAGATYPMEVYLFAGKVEGLDSGVYHYLIEQHCIELVKTGDRRQELANAALGQSSIKNAPAVIVLCADYSRTTARYGERGVRYVHIEAGHIGQNVHLQCEALGMGTVMIGAFDDGAVKKIIGTKFEPIYIMPFGYKRR